MGSPRLVDLSGLGPFLTEQSGSVWVGGLDDDGNYTGVVRRVERMGTEDTVINYLGANSHGSRQSYSSRGLAVWPHAALATQARYWKSPIFLASTCELTRVVSVTAPGTLPIVQQEADAPRYTEIDSLLVDVQSFLVNFPCSYHELLLIPFFEYSLLPSLLPFLHHRRESSLHVSDDERADDP